MCVRAAQGQGRELCSWPTPVCRRRWQMLLVYKARDSQCFGTSRKLSACHPLWNYKHWRVHLLYSAGHTIVTKLTTGTVSAFFVFFVCKRVQLQCTSTCPAKGFSDETDCNRETESLGVCVCVCVFVLPVHLFFLLLISYYAWKDWIESDLSLELSCTVCSQNDCHLSYDVLPVCAPAATTIQVLSIQKVLTLEDCMSWNTASG